MSVAFIILVFVRAYNVTTLSHVCSDTGIGLRGEIIDQLFQRLAGLLGALHDEEKNGGALLRLKDLIERIEKLLAVFADLTKASAQFLQGLLGRGGILGLSSSAQFLDDFLCAFTTSLNFVHSIGEQSFELIERNERDAKELVEVENGTFSSCSPVKVRLALVFQLSIRPPTLLSAMSLSSGE